MVSYEEECGLWVFVYKACKKGDNFSEIKEKGRKKKKCVKVTEGKFKEHKKQTQSKTCGLVCLRQCVKWSDEEDR